MAVVWHDLRRSLNDCDSNLKATDEQAPIVSASEDPAEDAPQGGFLSTEKGFLDSNSTSDT